MIAGTVMHFACSLVPSQKVEQPNQCSVAWKIRSKQQPSFEDWALDLLPVACHSGVNAAGGLLLALGDRLGRFAGASDVDVPWL